MSSIPETGLFENGPHGPRSIRAKDAVVVSRGRRQLSCGIIIAGESFYESRRGKSE